MLAAAVGTLGLVGCGADTVPVEAPGPADAGDRARCEALVGALPKTLADQSRRSIDPEDALGAAWGDPPIVLTCGGPLPDEFDRFSECEVGNDVGWFAPQEQVIDQSSDVEMTAVEYRPVVQVRLPADYRPSGVAAVMVDLAPVITEHLRLEARCR